MSSLIPEQRPDKNGTLVTRWVRSFAKKSSSKAIPAPPVGPALNPLPPDREKQYKDLSRNLQDTLKFGSIKSIDSGIETIARCDPYLLDRMTESIAADPEFQSMFWAEMLGNKHLDIGASPDKLESILEKFRATFAINAMLDRISERSGNQRNDVFDAFKMLDVVHAITIGKVGDENFDTAISAVTAVAYIKKLHGDVLVTGPDGMPVKYSDVWEEAQDIVSRAEDVGDILPELTRRGVFDRGIIDTLLEAPAPTLREGSL